MYQRWRQRLQHEPSLSNINEWPLIECDRLPSDRQKSFLRNQKMVAKVLSGQSLTQVGQAYNLSCASISQLMERCLGGDDSDTPSLTEGMIPYRQLKNPQRHTELPSLQQPSGARCAFQALLNEVPGLEDGLDKLIKKYLKRSDKAQTLTPLSFHGEFKRLLKVAGHPSDRYPYTHASVAYESIRQYLYKRTREFQLLDKIKKDQKSEQQHVIPSPATKKHHRALQDIQIDEQKADFQGRLTIELNDELIPLRVARGSLLLAVDAATDCYLGFHLAYTPAPNQQDLLQLQDNVIRPWTPMILTTPGLEYTPGACFPSGLPNGFPITFGTVQLDNAWLHRAKSVRKVITNDLGATLHLGRAGQPKQRNWVEVAFAYINKHVTHRFPSTTGSHPKDPVRESRNNAKRIPQVSIQTLIETLSIVLTHHNVLSLPHLGGQSSLSLLKHHCAHHYLRYTPDALRTHWKPFEAEEIVPIKSRVDSATPHINFYHVRYTGPGITKAALREKTVTVRFDRRDIRALKVFDKGGNFLGLTYAPKSWQRFPHSLATRQYICKLIRDQRLQGNDPLANFLHLLLKNKHHPNGALQLLRFYKEFSAGSTELAIPASLSTSSSKNALPLNGTGFNWTPASANRRV